MSRDRISKFGDPIRAQITEGCDLNEEGDIMQTIVRSTWICGIGFLTLENYDSKGSQVIINEQRWGKERVSIYLQMLVLNRQKT